MDPETSLTLVPGLGRGFAVQMTTNMCCRTPFCGRFHSAAVIGKVTAMALGGGVGSRHSVRFITKDSCDFQTMKHPFGFATRICCGTLDGLVPCGISGIHVDCCKHGVTDNCTAKLSVGLFKRFMPKASS